MGAAPLYLALGFTAKLPCHHVFPLRSALPQGARSDAIHPLGELRRAHQTGLHGDVSEVRSGDGLLVATYRRRTTTEHCDTLDHETTPLSPKLLAPLIVWPIGALLPSSLTGAAGGKTLSSIARTS